LKKILYYITDHGKGHATRSIAIIRELQKFGIDVTVINSNSIEFIQNSIPEIDIISHKTDVGLIVKDDAVSVDEDKSKNEMSKWIYSLDKHAREEKERISKLNPDLIISDISAMPLLVAKAMNIPSMAISNFSWYDSSNFLEKDTLEILKQAYDCASIAIKLPFGTPMKHFKNTYQVGIVARKTERTKQQIKAQLGISNSEFVVLYAMGTDSYKIKCSYDKNIRVLSINSSVTNSINNSKIPNISTWTEGQELVSISNLVICKSGYGMISECLTNGVPFFYLSDKNRIELNMISDELAKIELNNEITMSKINSLHLSKNYLDTLTQYEKIPIDTLNVVQKILEFFK
jgi:uncharacterized protein (TIGR00661 family)